MLKYLSVASEKVNYLAFYDKSRFVDAIKIQAVISGLASKRWEFENFGSKVKNGGWVDFPGLLSEENSFTQNPSIRELQKYLTTHGLDEVPLVQNGTLVGFLNYKSISNELYSQASGG